MSKNKSKQKKNKGNEPYYQLEDLKLKNLQQNNPLYSTIKKGNTKHENVKQSYIKEEGKTTEYTRKNSVDLEDYNNANSRKSENPIYNIANSGKSKKYNTYNSANSGKSKKYNTYNSANSRNSENHIYNNANSGNSENHIYNNANSGNSDNNTYNIANFNESGYSLNPIHSNNLYNQPSELQTQNKKLITSRPLPPTPNNHQNLNNTTYNKFSQEHKTNSIVKKIKKLEISNNQFKKIKNKLMEELDNNKNNPDYVDCIKIIINYIDNIIINNTRQISVNKRKIALYEMDIKAKTERINRIEKNILKLSNKKNMNKNDTNKLNALESKKESLKTELKALIEQPPEYNNSTSQYNSISPSPPPVPSRGTNHRYILNNPNYNSDGYLQPNGHNSQGDYNNPSNERGPFNAYGSNIPKGHYNTNPRLNINLTEFVNAQKKSKKHNTTKNSILPRNFNTKTRKKNTKNTQLTRVKTI
jgi:hypothetical protein